MFCSKCGRELRDDEVFCSACGNKIIRENECNVTGKTDFKSENKSSEPIYIREARVRRPISKGLSKIAIKIALILIAVCIVVECNYHIKELNIRDEYHEPQDKLSEKKIGKN